MITITITAEEVSIDPKNKNSIEVTLKGIDVIKDRLKLYSIEDINPDFKDI
jgi:hypothetical protein